MLLSNEDESVSDIIVEVSAGVGGQEAMLFASELHQLYYNYFNFCGWTFQLANLEETEIGMRMQVMDNQKFNYYFMYLIVSNYVQ